jgi:hypothetical protein
MRKILVLLFISIALFAKAQLGFSAIENNMGIIQEA